MTCNKRQRILFLGAGFSHNFGHPLTQELWGKLFNHPKIKTNESIREILRIIQNYEVAYAQIIKDCSSKDIELATQCILEVFEEMDEQVIAYLSKGNKSINIFKLKKFLGRFVGTTQNPGRVFSLNHDILIERLLYNESNLLTLSLPFIESSFIGKSNRAAVTITNYSCLRKNIIENKTYDYEQYALEYIPNTTNILEYIKLHGSFSWKAKNGKLMIVIGEEKETAIKKICFLMSITKYLKKPYQIVQKSFALGTGLMIPI